MNIGGANGWISTFAIDGDSLTAWIAANTSSAGNVHLWWAKPRDVSVAADAWWTAYTNNHADLTATTVPNAGIVCANGTNDGSGGAINQC